MRHQRKTLDEFYHSGLQDTNSWNAGQTVSKWTGTSYESLENGRSQAVENSHVVMVDQLWIWALDECECPDRGFHLFLMALDDATQYSSQLD